MLPDGVAYEANKVLEGTICCGTARRHAQFSDGRVEAGKTGTTNDYKDAWFCGYTPNLADLRVGRLPAGRDHAAAT